MERVNTASSQMTMIVLNLVMKSLTASVIAMTVTAGGSGHLPRLGSKH
jgi:hypothetical protein